MEFEEFCILASKFLTEEEEGGSEEMLTSELKEAFRFYDKEGNESDCEVVNLERKYLYLTKFEFNSFTIIN